MAQARESASPQPEPASSSHQQPQRSESALNRLMATSAPSIAGSAQSAKSAPARTATPTSTRASPIPSASHVIGTPVTTPPASHRAPVHAAPVSVTKVPYDQWESDKIGEVLGVCLTVSIGTQRTFATDLI